MLVCLAATAIPGVAGLKLPKKCIEHSFEPVDLDIRCLLIVLFEEVEWKISSNKDPG